jgi:hypothetical protein
MLLFVHHHVVPSNTMNKGLYVKEIIVNAAKAGKQNSHMIWATNKIWLCINILHIKINMTLNYKIKFRDLFYNTALNYKHI